MLIGPGSHDLEPIGRALMSRGLKPMLAESAVYAGDHLKRGLTPKFVFLDMRAGDPSALEILDVLKGAFGALPVVAVVSVRQARTAVLAIQHGAASFLFCPFEDSDFNMILDDLSKPAAHPCAASLGDNGNEFISVTEKMLQIKDIVRQVASTDVPILIQGESGVGKEVITLYLHDQSERRQGPFIKVNCAALSPELIESELFGHEKGAFTGATAQGVGKFALSHGGTLFLDEITELSLPIQAKLLHVLQDGRYFKVGGTRYLESDARVVAATNHDLTEAVCAGRFREDLYFRLDVVGIKIPPLRERKEDIFPLCQFFLKKYASKYNRSHYELSPRILSLFEAYCWPGNVRELENVIRRLLVLPDEGMVLRSIEAAIEHSSISNGVPPTNISLHDPSLKALQAQHRLNTSHAEREIILKTLDNTKWNRKKAAVQLGISYKTLLNKLEKWDLQRPS